jgi:outer membrane protein assembly factor BamB
VSSIEAEVPTALSLHGERIAISRAGGRQLPAPCEVVSTLLVRSWTELKKDMRTRCLFLIVISLILCEICPAQTADWPTFGHDPQRSGWAFGETTLDQENVASLGLRWKVQLNNKPKSLVSLLTPVVAGDVGTAQGIKTVVYVAGSSNTLFALEAEKGQLLWSQTFESSVLPKEQGYWLCPNALNATPTIDRTRNTVFTVADDGKLYGSDLGTGVIKFGPIQFLPPFSKSWSLNHLDGTVYASVSSTCGGSRPGLYAIDTRDPHRPVIHELLTARNGAGIWGRGGAVIGSNNRVYGTTADGDFDPSAGDFADSFVAASVPELKLVDYYTPFNRERIQEYDLDLASASPVYFAYKNYNLVAGGGKQGYLYLLDADSLGNKDHQTPLFVTPRLANDEETYEANGIWGALSVWRDAEDQTWLYVPLWGRLSKEAPTFARTNGPVVHGCIAAFKVKSGDASGKPVLEPAWISADLNLPEPVVIANGVVFVLSNGENARQTHEGGVITQKWTLLSDAEKLLNTRNAVLYALDAKTGKMLYQSGDAIQGWVHFSGLALAQGQIFAVDHDSWVYCFGLKSRP